MMNSSLENNHDGKEAPIFGIPLAASLSSSFESGSTAKIEIHLEDCVQGMARLPAASIDVVVTSPPYNLGTAYHTYNDRGDRQAYLAWTCEWATQVKRVLREDGSFFLNVGGTPANPFLPHEVVLGLRELFVLQNTFHWIKSITVETKGGETISAGHFKPINSHRFITDCHEYLFH